jgi:hypothetical protein
MNQKPCPFCHQLSSAHCPHLALAVEGREFVHACIEKSEGERQWQALCQHRKEQRLLRGEWTPEQEDFTWLETAFCDTFLKHLRWFGGLEHEWRTGPRPEQGGYWVLLWSKDPQRLWWELRDELERQRSQPVETRVPMYR